MLTKEEALRKAWSYLEDHGFDLTRQPDSVKLITKQSMEEGKEAEELKARRPETWEYIRSTFRDRWCILFKTGFHSPPYNVVLVDAETGEVTVPPVL